MRLGHFSKIINCISSTWKAIIYLSRILCAWAVLINSSIAFLQHEKSLSVSSKISTLWPSQQNTIHSFHLFIVHNGEYLFRWGFQPTSRCNEKPKMDDLHSRNYREQSIYAPMKMNTLLPIVHFSVHWGRHRSSFLAIIFDFKHHFEWLVFFSQKISVSTLPTWIYSFFTELESFFLFFRFSIQIENVNQIFQDRRLKKLSFQISINAK